MKNYSIAALFTLLTAVGFAQKSTKPGASSVSLNFSGVPVAKISGIDTSYQNVLSISPVFDLRSRSGWGVTYSPSMVISDHKSGIFMHSFSAGYEQYGKRNFDLAFNYSHYIFTNKTDVPFTPLNNEIFFFFAYSKTWVRPVFATSIGFGKDASNTPVHDIGLAGGLSHEFSWEDKGIFSSIEVTPSVLLNAGTNVYFSFLQVSRYISHSRNFAKYVKKGGNRKGATTRSSMEISNLEFNLESKFEMGPLSIHPSGSIFFPASSGTDNAVYGFGEICIQYHF